MDAEARRRLLGAQVLVGVVVCFALWFLQTPSWAQPLAPIVAAADPLVTLPSVEITVNEVVASGFDHPVQVIAPGDGSGRLFVVEQPGRIRIVRNGVVELTPFLDLTSQVSYAGERGLLGLAFHPDYENNGHCYVNYTRPGDGATVIARYQASTLDPDKADPSSAQTLLTIAQPYENHNGGQLLFGPHDGYLYIGMGDGGSGGDPLDQGQDPNTLLGVMLRLDVDGGFPYAIPADNPYVGSYGLDEIWAIGLRNPWRFSFDRDTGDLYIGDVGQNQWEEIDYQSAGTPGGLNFGWRCMEGTHEYDFAGDCLSSDLTDPIAEYSHTDGRSITGGFVYRGSSFPALRGRYFYADYVEGKIWSLYKKGSNPDTWSEPELELDTGLNIGAFGEDANGELLVIDYGGGTIHRLADVHALAPDLSLSRKRGSSLRADPSEVVTFTIQLANPGSLASRPVVVTDTVPTGLSYVAGSLQASHGIWDDQQAPVLTWHGNLDAGHHMTITYRVAATGQVTGSIVNQASMTSPGLDTLTLAASLSVPRSVLTTTREDFFSPGTQPGALNQAIPPSIDCDTCHSEPVYDRWRGSMMAQAGRDPLMWAALAVANVDAPDSGDYCLRCHTPKGWLEGRSHPGDGSALKADDLSNGVACGLCHRVVDPVSSVVDETTAIDQAIRAGLPDPIPAGYVGSGALIVDPDDNRRGPFTFSEPLPYHSAYQTAPFRQTSDAAGRARLCGTCHNVDNPILVWDVGKGQYWPNLSGFAAGELFPVERTYDEWLYSDYARQGVYAPRFAGRKADGFVSACQDCHLPRATGIAADPAFNPVTRDCQTTGCLPQHIMVGGNTWIPELIQNPGWRLSAESEAGYLHETMSQARQMLSNAATVSVALTTSDTVKIATVRVTNHTGHKFPTGYPEGRLTWLNLKAYDAEGNLLYESGIYDEGTGRLQRDPDVKVYEVKQGITPELAAFLGKAAGASFHFVLNNTTVKDNRIPPVGYKQALYDKPGLRPVGANYADGQFWDDTTYTVPMGTERLIATLYYQTASREYVEFLASSGGVDGLALAELWASLKSPPQVVARAWVPSWDIYLPIISRS